jgi:hypothetical protein
MDLASKSLCFCSIEFYIHFDESLYLHPSIFAKHTQGGGGYGSGVANWANTSFTLVRG